jgi:uncharacterized protein YkwD
MIPTRNKPTFRQLFYVLVVFTAILLSAGLLSSRAAAQNQIFLPVIFKATCLSTSQEQELADLLLNDPNQKHPVLTCHPTLAAVAHQRAADMAQRGYFSHVTPEGYGSNYLVRQAGYVLPSYYSTALDANNIESIAAGNATAAATWQQWLGSTAHRTQLLGLDPFYAEQTQYGIGYAYNPNSPFQYYWVVITAKPGP